MPPMYRPLERGICVAGHPKKRIVPHHVLRFCLQDSSAQNQNTNSQPSVAGYNFDSTFVVAWFYRECYLYLARFMNTLDPGARKV